MDSRVEYGHPKRGEQVSDQQPQRLTGDIETHFGERRVTADEKTQLVGDVFASVASRYDLMNDVMSGGIHRLWKARFVRSLGLRPGMAVLDLAGGTGDIAFAIVERLRRLAQREQGAGDAVLKPPVNICDINPSMLAVGRDRALDRGLEHQVRWSCGNAESLPFPDRSFDRVTISFGLRNVTDIDAALAEAHRVLKPGGRFFCLEFSRVTQPMLRKLYDAYSYNFIPRFGSAIAGDRESYQYLVESIRKFPSQKELAGRMQTAGLNRVRYENLSAGIAAIHSGWRI
ncbi:MAG: class I SAM-dependent methyltransferase [Alphaproteobacteria bacterium]|nr:class I SAM-dependent methyltransferase [Alphaproteobacteria bacterium SS10]